MFVRSLTGTQGEISFPIIGAKLGTFKSWQLTRHEDNGDHAGLFVLRAVFSYVNPVLWDQPYSMEIRISVGRKDYLLEQMPGSTKTLIHSQLLMEGIKLCPAQ